MTCREGERGRGGEKNANVPFSPYSQFPISEFGSTLVVAPHPDDESLGCGGAIALLRRMGYAVRVLVISDGTRSHPNSRKYPAPALQALREQEALTALSILGVAADAVTFWRLPDGAVPKKGVAGFEEAIALCHSYLANNVPQTILLPWRRDPHSDHRASWELIHTAVANLHPSPRLLEYLIWDWDSTQRDDASPLSVLINDNLSKSKEGDRGGIASTTQHSIKAWRVDINECLAQKKAAIAAHRSQTTNLIDDDPKSFRLTPEMLANFTHPWELYLEVGNS